MEFYKMQRMLFAEQAKNVEMQRCLQGTFACLYMCVCLQCTYLLMHAFFYLEMMQKMQSIAIQNAKSLGQLTEKCSQFHERCIPQNVQKSLNMGIAACEYRDQRDKLQEKKNIGRQEAETIMEQERLNDLNVWESCVPAPTSSRTCRAFTRKITRKITSQLRKANLESKGFVGMRMHTQTYIHNIDPPVCCLQMPRRRCPRLWNFLSKRATRHLR